MGVYIFNWKVLKKYLKKDEKNPESSNDFGKNIIPRMLEDGCRMYAYPFRGYWKDVGTLQSLWEANMDLLGDTPKFSLSDTRWRICSRGGGEPPHLIGEYGRVVNSMVTGGCEIHGIVENSVLSSGVRVARGAYVKDSVLMRGVTVGEGATVNYSIIDSDAEIGAGAVIGRTKGIAQAVTVIEGGRRVNPGDAVHADQQNA